jgi:hypothetical protein
MIANLNLRSDTASSLKVTLLIETLMSGKIAASIAEFPTFRVEAETQESAVQQLQLNFLERAKYIETIAWEVPLYSIEPEQPVIPVENPWLAIAGKYADDPNWDDYQASIAEARHKTNADMVLNGESIA